MAHDFRICKLCESDGAIPTYVLPDIGTVFVCRHCKLHSLDFLDDAPTFDAPPPTDVAVKKHAEYVDRVLQSNREKFASRVQTLKQHMQLAQQRCMDVGAGGGVFLDLLRSQGAQVHGIEPDPLNRRFAHDRYGLNLRSELVDNACWKAEHGSFDLVTLWDVIEHVNFPRQTLADVAKLLRPGGTLGLDTPARDAFLYRTGEWMYRLSGGRLWSMLATQYSRQSFGHKQIFASQGLLELLRSLGFESVFCIKVHEISFPYHVYLQRILRSSRAAKLAAPLADVVFRLMPVRNKIVLVARKT